ncbi:MULTISPECIES: CoA-transferase subunit beta [unclassified Saccharopolyspora]|uniref:CoA-transferase subunit beta n=1 Tax=unclassified Saccharopolyspora TaxID=2646250 RepID=UPI001CD646C2|nr:MULTISPECIES: CoA-transferase [unclassified Saccharopolyspora]MCA1193762.1 CoA-transferase [Saccharopolyspora sp. 6V]MCA1280398.1 CoA-transferase [Saccharopolyspora sp. 7B]
MDATRAEVCAAACADSWHDAGEVLASPFGLIPALGARLARLTTAPDLLLTDGEAVLLTEPPPLGRESEAATAEGWMPYRRVLDLLAGGRRRVMMGATQIDRYGNQNISRIGPWERPKVQLIGVRGAPGNSVNHVTNYWVPKHGERTFVERVDLVCGVGHDRATGAAGRFHDVRVVVTDLAVLDFAGPDRTMRLRSVHPGVTVREVRQRTGFELDTSAVAETRLPSAEELELIRGRLDPDGLRHREVPA